MTTGPDWIATPPPPETPPGVYWVAVYIREYERWLHWLRRIGDVDVNSIRPPLLPVHQWSERHRWWPVPVELPALPATLPSRRADQA